MYLTKTDYIHYLCCPKSLWLLKRRPDAYPRRDFNDFLKKIAREGYEVEDHARQLFPGGVAIPPGDRAEPRTREALDSGAPALFQATVETDDGLFARADVLERHDDGSLCLYEVKSTTSVKRDRRHNHIKDACFQTIAFARAGIPIQKTFIMHVNSEYVLGEALDPRGLLTTLDVSDEVRSVTAETEAEIAGALSLLRAPSIDESGCACHRKTRSNHCDAFSHFNGDVPEESVWDLGGIREKRLVGLLESGIVLLKDIPADADLNDRQIRQARSALEGEPIIDRARIIAMLEDLAFPLCFLDYETAVHAVPKRVGSRPWQHIPFQFSLHILDRDGSLRHEEFLGDSLADTDDLPRALRAAMESVGTPISWHAPFEKQVNREMAKRHPEHRDFLERMNDDMFDLEDVFKEAYTDSRFRGSTSIKKVLPILCPHLSYENLRVQDGTRAMEQWFAMTEHPSQSARDGIRKDLLEYCALDTLAMVELYRRLIAITESSG